MTKITFYKITLGFSFVFVMLLAVFANASITRQQNSQKFITQTRSVLPSAPIKSVDNMLRVNTFQYLSYILSDKEEALKEKLISRYSLSVKKAERYAKVIAKVSHTYNIPTDLMAALIRTESNYFDRAVSHKNAVGPAQIIAKYWKNDCAKDLFNISNNIQCAAIILNRYKSMCRNNWDCALKMYNVGPGNYYKKTKYYQQAGVRYLSKINKNRKRLNS